MSDSTRVSWQLMSPARTMLGIAIVAASIGGIPLLASVPSKSSNPQLAMVGLGVWAIMVLFACSRGGCRLDLGARKLTRWWGPFLPVYSRDIDFDAILQVHLVLNKKANSRESGDDFRVTLITTKGVVLVRWTKSLKDAEGLGLMISEFVNCPYFVGSGRGDATLFTPASRQDNA